MERDGVVSIVQPMCKLVWQICRKGRADMIRVIRHVTVEPVAGA
jgi:hypothetical protein